MFKILVSGGPFGPAPPADNPTEPRRRAAQHNETPGRQIKQSNQLSLSLFPIKTIAILEWT